MSELLHLSATEVLAKFANKSLSPVELLDVEENRKIGNVTRLNSLA